MSDVFIPTNTKGLCGRCGKTRGMHHFEHDYNDGDKKVMVYCTPPKKGDAPVAASNEDLEALWEPTASQCSSCGHTSSNGGKYLYKVNEAYRYCIWCQARGGRGNVMRLILVRNLANRDCEATVPQVNEVTDDQGAIIATTWDEVDCGKCLPCLARKWSDHPFA